MALVEIGRQDPTKRSQPVQALHRSDDPHGWHELPALPDVSVRRSRFINVSICDDSVVIEAGFQDRVGDPTVGSVAIHEHRIQARADVRTLTLTALSADPRILPFRECPAAAESAQLMLGAELGDFRSIVLDRLAGTSGCTHLNDALRGFADVPVLLNALHAHR